MNVLNLGRLFNIAAIISFAYASDYWSSFIMLCLYSYREYGIYKEIVYTTRFVITYIVIFITLLISSIWNLAT